MSSVITPRSYMDRRAAAVEAAPITSASKAATTKTASNNGSEFFGEDGPGFRDVLDAINPLNHIPLVSGMLEDATGHKPSVASKLAGGALFGPIGFVASLANVIFEQQTGKDVGNTMVAALSDDTPADTQLASTDQSDETQVAANTAVPEVETVEAQQFASLDTKAMRDQDMALNAQMALGRSTTTAANEVNRRDIDKDRAVLDLFGASAPKGASQAYEKAKLLPYLRAANNTQVL